VEVFAVEEGIDQRIPQSLPRGRISVIAQLPNASRQSRQGQAVPAGQHLVIPREWTLRARGQQRRARRGQIRAQHRRVEGVARRDRRWVSLPARQQAGFELGRPIKPPGQRYRGTLRRGQQTRQVRGHPEIVAAFDAVGVHGRKARDHEPVPCRHRRQHKVERVPGHVAIPGLVEDGSGMQVERYEQGLGVQHLFEVRHLPVGVHGVAEEAASDKVPKSLARHFVQCQPQQRGKVPHIRVGRIGLPRHQFQQHRELGRAREAALVAETAGHRITERQRALDQALPNPVAVRGRQCQRRGRRPRLLGPFPRGPARDPGQVLGVGVPGGGETLE
jgi:hypothetical protein